MCVGPSGYPGQLDTSSISVMGIDGAVTFASIGSRSKEVDALLDSATWLRRLRTAVRSGQFGEDSIVDHPHFQEIPRRRHVRVIASNVDQAILGTCLSVCMYVMAWGLVQTCTYVPLCYHDSMLISLCIDDHHPYMAHHSYPCVMTLCRLLCVLVPPTVLLHHLRLAHRDQAAVLFHGHHG